MKSMNLHFTSSRGFLLILFSTFPQVHSLNFSMAIDSSEWIGSAYYWFWGPDATVTVETLNSSAQVRNMSLIEQLKAFIGVSLTNVKKVDVEPLWKQGLFTFPILGLDGVLVKSSPFDACSTINLPPKEPTLVEEEIEENVHNSTHTGRMKWILIVDENYCDIDTKILNANEAGYSAVLLLSTYNDLSKTEEYNETSYLKIFPARIDIYDGLSLANDYTYPQPYTAKLQDMRNLQWAYATGKIIGLTVLCVIVTAAIMIVIVKALRRRSYAADVREADEMRERLHRIIDNLPITVWELNQLTKDEKCLICFGLFHQNDIIRTLPCYHRFHQRCIMARFENDYADCAVCHYKLLSSETKSTEKTPLLF